MKVKLAPIAFAVCSALPLAAHAVPSGVRFVSPTNGQTVSGDLSSTCELQGSGVSTVRFYLDGNEISRDTGSPFNCALDTRKFPNGSHRLQARAYDASGSVRTEIGINIQNGTTSGGDSGGSTGGSTGGTPPVISWASPASGATVSGYLSDCQVLVTDSDGVKQVDWYLDSTKINTEMVAPYDTCKLDSRKFSDGTHQLKAVAYDTKGASATSSRSITVKNGTSSGGDSGGDSGSGTTNPGPVVAFTAPASGATIAGFFDKCAVTAADADGVAQVDWYLDSTRINTEKVAPWETCNLDSRKFSDGTHQLKAVATDAKGATTTASLSISINNNGGSSGGGSGGDSGGSTGGDSGGGSSLPSTNTKAVPTFHSLGLYWKPGSNPGSAGCEVRYRKTGDSSWKQGLNLWYDSRNSECRGSLVHLSPNSEYEVQFAMPGKSPSAGLKAKTWSEQFPIAKTVKVSNRSTTLEITEGGTKDGYVLYEGPATIDVNKSADFNIKISAPYVIVRGLTLKGAKVDGIRLVEGSHDVVIEGNDISDWGTYRYTNAEGWKIGLNGQAGIAAWCRSGPFLERLIVQRNKIHHPTYGSNSWSDGHPAGPNAILFHECGGGHVFRYNEFYSQWGRYFMDVIGGEENFSEKGMPNADTDIYGNVLKHAWDDAIEAEGAGRNVRIWGNYMDETTTGVASTVVHVGPMYIFRNVYNRSRMLSKKSLDDDSRNVFFKSGDKGTTWGSGRRYVFHNTMLQAPPPSGTQYTLGGGGGLAGPNSSDKLVNTVSRNNIFHIWKTWWPSIDTKGGSGNDLDYDLVNGNVTAYSGAEANRVTGVPVYQSGHGWQSGQGGLYQLAPGSPGHGKGAKIPNFNDGVSAPDMGAHQSGAPAMKFGVQ
jgi:hypothetical protein